MSYKIFSPLEQFEIIPIIPISNLMPFSNATTYGIVVLTVAFIFFHLALQKSFIVPRPWQFAAEKGHSFIGELVRQQAGPEAEFYLPLFLSIFIFILFSNLLGLIPFSFAITGQLAATLTLALSMNFGFLVLGVVKHKREFFKLFVPSGVPAAALPLIVLIEVVSYLLRTFSLSVRLFANIMAGHTLLHILRSFVLILFQTNWIFVSLVPFVLVLSITILEFAIAFLQSYVFVVLLAIYLNDSFHPAH